MPKSDIISCSIIVDHYEDSISILMVITTRKAGQYASIVSEQFLEGIVNGQEDTVIAAQCSMSLRFVITKEIKAKCADVLAMLSTSRVSTPLNEFGGEDARLILGVDPENPTSFL